MIYSIYFSLTKQTVQMNKFIYSSMLVWLMLLGFNTNTTAQVCRPAIDCKFGTPDAIGWAMQNFFNDGSTASWNFQAGAVFQENTDGTATLTGVVTQYGTGVSGIPARSFTVKVNFTGKSSTTTGTPETNNGCPPPSTSGWFYYTLSSGTMTGVSGTAAQGATLALTQHMMPAQYGIGAANQCAETTKLGLTGWFEWTVQSQPSNGWLLIMPYPSSPVIGQADICININGTPYNCGPTPPPPTCKPAIVCPPNMTKIPTNNLTCWTNFTWTTPVATTSDPSCSTPKVTQISGPASGSCIGYGVSTVTYKATDNAGNMATCSFTITVVPPGNPCDNDVTPPVITCPPNMTKTPTNNLTCWTSFTWNDATATDNCCTPTVKQISGPTSGSCIGYGVSTVTYRATDKKGNTADCSFTITVTPPNNPCTNDVTPPVITCPANMTKTPTNNLTCWTSFTWNDATATDNCCTPTVKQISGPTSGSCIGYGVSTVTYRATDKKGNTADCSFTITVVKPTCTTSYDPNKCYKLVPHGYNNMCLGFSNNYNYNWSGAQVSACNYNGLSCQKWQFENLGGSSCRLKNVQYGRYMGAQKQSWWGWDWDDKNVCTYSSWDNADKDWTIECNNDGSYSFKHNSSNLKCGYNWGNSCSLNASNQEFDIIEVAWGDDQHDQQDQHAQTSQVFVTGAEAEANRVRIDFSTNQGFATDYFNVQKLNIATGAFETLEIINNKVTDNSLQAHSVYDNAPIEGDNYYQVEISLNNGTKTLSEIQKVNFTLIKGLVLFPNPASDYIDVNLKDYKGKNVTIYLYNQIGVTQVVRQVQNAGLIPEHIELGDLSGGQYLLRVESKGVRDAVKAVMVQK